MGFRSEEAHMTTSPPAFRVTDRALRPDERDELVARIQAS